MTWLDDPKNFEEMRQNFTTALRINEGPNMSLPEMSERLCEFRDEIERLRDVLKKISVHTDVSGIDDLRLPHAKRMLALAHKFAASEQEDGD